MREQDGSDGAAAYQLFTGSLAVSYSMQLALANHMVFVLKPVNARAGGGGPNDGEISPGAEKRKEAPDSSGASR